MQIDELRGGLHELADEMEPFQPDAIAAHRKVRRQRIVTSAVAAVVAIALAAGGFALARAGVHRRVDVVSNPQKELSPSDLHRVDVIVLPGSAATQRVLEASPDVGAYTAVAQGLRSIDNAATLLVPKGATDAVCALRTSSGFAVEAAAPNTDIAGSLAQALGSGARVFDITKGAGADAEIFMKMSASQTETDTMRTALTQDRDVASFTFVDHQAAYARFKQEFADNPGLIATATPASLPESFKLYLADGVKAETIETRYRTMHGVDSINLGNAVVASLVRPPLLTRTQPEIFMKIGASQQQVDHIRLLIESDSAVASFMFFNHQAALLRFRTEFASQPGLLRTVTADQLPESFLITFRQPATAGELQRRYDSEPGVDAVIVPPAPTACPSTP